jgi:hypothetical protein
MVFLENRNLQILEPKLVPPRTLLDLKQGVMYCPQRTLNTLEKIFALSGEREG